MTDDRANYRDPSENNFPSDYDPSKVDSRILIRSKAVREKMYGLDVRGALGQGIEIAGEVASEAKKTSSQTAQRQSRLEKRYEDQIKGSTDISEVIDARRQLGADEAFPLLGDRLNWNDEQIEDFNYSELFGSRFPSLKKRGSYYDSRIASIGINVEDYGAVGDGVTDDTAAIQAAFNSSIYVRGKIVFTRGKKYLLTAGIDNPVGNSKEVDFCGATIHAGADMDYMFKFQNGRFIQNGIFTKEQGKTVTSVFRLSGNNYNIHSLVSGNHKFDVFFDCYNVKESRIHNCRIDMDVENRLGIVIRSNYSVNNMVFGNYWGSGNNVIECTDAQEPTHSYSSEGWIFENNVFLMFRTPFKLDKATAITITSNVIDFVKTRFIIATLGGVLHVSDNWVALDSTSVTGVELSGRFDEANIHHNTFVGNSALDCTVIIAANKSTVWDGNQVRGRFKALGTLTSRNSVETSSNVYMIDNLSDPIMTAYRRNGAFFVIGTESLRMNESYVTFRVEVTEQGTGSFLALEGYREKSNPVYNVTSKIGNLNVLATNTLGTIAFSGYTNLSRLVIKTEVQLLPVL